MELRQAALRMALVGMAISVVVGLGGTYFAFHDAGGVAVPFIKAGWGASLYLDLLITAVAVGLFVPWVMVEQARNMIRVETLYVDPRRQIREGKRWKTKGFPAGCLMTVILLCIHLILAIPLYYAPGDIELSSMGAILLVKFFYTAVLAFTVAFLTFSVSARNQDAIRRAGLHSL